MHDLPMTATSAAPRGHALSVAVTRGILAGGVVAGVLDIFVASAINHAPPGLILQAIASGLLGKATYQGGAQTAGLGLLLQVAMSLIIATIYGLAGTRLPSLFTRPLRYGALYGVGVFVVMSFVVVPLSAAYPRPAPTLSGAVLNLAAMILFGLILSLAQWLSHRRP